MGQILFYTFGTKNLQQPRPAADFYVDCRSLKNPPHALFHLDGRDPAVAKAIQEATTAGRIERTDSYVRQRVGEAVVQGRSLTVAFFCIGGRHRSVFMAEYIRKHLRDLAAIEVNVRHFALP